MSLDRAFYIARREYVENIRTKGFWFGILMLPIMLLIIAIVPIIINSTKAPKSYTVIDQSGWLHESIQKEIDRRDFIHYLSEPIDSTFHTPFDDLRRLVNNEDAQSLSTITANLFSSPLAVSADFDALQIPTTTKQQIIKNRDAARQWWHSLSRQEKSKLSARISTNHFLLSRHKDLTPSALNKAIQANELFAYFKIEADPLRSSSPVLYVSNNLTDTELKSWLQQFATDVVRKARLKDKNVDPTIASWINEPLIFRGIQIDAEGHEESVNSDDVIRQWLPVVFVYLLWISILISSQMLLTNTIEEKSNKLIEVLLSSVSPLVLMAGKIAGIAATGLTIILFWGAMLLMILGVLPQVLGASLPPLGEIILSDPWFLGSFIVYFILGYLLYAAILVGLGSVCNNLKEAQNLTLPVQLIQMLPLLVMIPIGKDPNGLLAQTLSYFPPLTPFVMMNRAAAPPTSMEYFLTTLLLLISIVVALWVAAKIFRIGILMTGKPPSILAIIKLLRQPVVFQPTDTNNSFLPPTDK